MCVVDVLVDVMLGDCGKGKISKALNELYGYDAICKFNGGKMQDMQYGLVTEN